MDRRINLGYSLPPAPLPLMRSKVALLAAHDIAPSPATCWEQAHPEGQASYHNCQWSGSGNQGQGASAYPNAGKRTVYYPILGSRKNGGPGVQALRTKARPWRLKFFRAQPPACFWVLFAGAKRTSPSGET